MAAFFVVILFLWQGNKGFNLWDEGYLWYGAQRVMVGEVPIRDFSAYDPGRYYWSASLMKLWGDNGIMALRGSVAVFQLFGLFIGLLLIDRSAKKQSLTFLLLSAATLVVWMFPRHKLFDISLSVLLIGALSYLVHKPTGGRYFITGLCVGLAAVFGRNHGVYGVAGSIGVMLWLRIGKAEGPTFIKGFSLWAAGVVTGFSPILLMILLIPGFASAFWNDILFLFEIKATNIPLPVPWPWRVDLLSKTFGEAVREVLIGLFFIGIVVFGLLSVAWVIRQKIRDKQVSSTLVAASFLSLPYVHFTFSRADIGHLAQGIYPFLIGILALLAVQPAKVKLPLAFMLCAASLWVMHVFQPGWQCYGSEECVSIKISQSDFLVDTRTASDIKLLRKLADQYAPHNQTFIVAPFWPGAYALLERKSPMWDNYILFPCAKAFEQSEIERIKAAKPRFVLIFDYLLDGRDELRFKNMRPLINQYIVNHFDRIPYSPNPAYQIYTVKEGKL